MWEEKALNLKLLSLVNKTICKMAEPRNGQRQEPSGHVTWIKLCLKPTMLVFQLYEPGPLFKPVLHGFLSLSANGPQQTKRLSEMVLFVG